MLNDPLANVLSMINKYDQQGKKECLLHPMSSMIERTLAIMQAHRYVGSTEPVTQSRGGVVKINLLGSVNKCGVIKPRWAVKVDDFEKYEKRYLPAKGMGIIILSTSQGLLTHEEAKEKNIGGRLIAYCY
ncbi:30S ribosomal protein S8 [Candidatus Woesearchaeota archaeon]|nr:30S ribosomal protein S8 [Candidatus Woesearchaeota archaeon]